MLKVNQRLSATVGQLTGQVQAAQAGAHAAGNVDRFRPAAPPKFGNNSKDSDVREWLPVIEDYLRHASDQDYIRLASSYLEGGPRSLWTTLYEAYRVAHGNQEPPTLECSSVRRWSRITVSRILTRSTGTPGTPFVGNLMFRILTSTMSRFSRRSETWQGP
jgi:hypothetical protein